MPAWKVLLVLVLGLTCFGLAISTIVVPLSMPEDPYKWAWCGGFFAGTVVMGSLFAMFLRAQDRKVKW